MEPATKTCSYRAILRAGEETIELASTLLTTYTDCVGTELVDRDVERESDAAELDHEVGTLVAYFERNSAERALEIRDKIRRALSNLDPGTWELHECARYTDESWRESWKEFFEPRQLSPRVRVGPPWRADDIPEPEGGVSLVIDPGMAFGTGLHETTQLAAELLDDRLESRPGRDVLDVGSGTAVLSMAAARLGAGDVRGIDVEPAAIDAARENLRRNELTERVVVEREPLAAIERRYDLVVANILAHILFDLRDELLQHVAAEGELILSGVPADRASSFLEEFSPADWLLLERRRRGEWSAFALAPE